MTLAPGSVGTRCRGPGCPRGALDRSGPQPGGSFLCSRGHFPCCRLPVWDVVQQTGGAGPGVVFLA
jgi:hypothetical protein